MGKTTIEVKEVKQNIRTKLLQFLFNVDPHQMERFFTSNILTRTLANLCGVSEYGTVLLKCTADGSLHTAVTEAGFSHWEVHRGSVIFGGGDIITPLFSNEKCYIRCSGGDFRIQYTKDGINYYPYFLQPDNTVFELPISSKKLFLTPETVGTTVVYEILYYRI